MRSAKDGVCDCKTRSWARPFTGRFASVNFNVRLLEGKLVTLTKWQLLLFVTANFASSSFLGRRLAFMSTYHPWTVKRNSGLHHR